MSYKNYALVFLVIILIWVLSFGIHLFELKDSFKLDRIPFSNIEFIEVNGRGLHSVHAQIKDAGDIRLLDSLLILSKTIERDNVNFKSHHDFYEIIIHFKNREPMDVSLIEAPFFKSSNLHGVVSSGDYYYQNDIFLDYILKRVGVRK